jgi:hypothetical protein
VSATGLSSSLPDVVCRPTTSATESTVRIDSAARVAKPGEAQGAAVEIPAFDSPASYKSYRSRLLEDKEARANFTAAQEKKFIVREERSFLRAVDGYVAVRFDDGRNASVTSAHASTSRATANGGHRPHAAPRQ